jgi:hypothetical protein
MLPKANSDGDPSLGASTIDCRLESFSASISGMSETSIESPPGFSELPKAEQVRYLQALWDQISTNPDEIPVPESHLHLAEERLRRYRENPSTAKSAFEVIDRLAGKSK